MFRTFTTLAVAGLFVATAQAENVKTVTTALSYQQNLLQSEEGAEETLLSLTRQARRACRTVSMVTASFQVDQRCVDTLVQSAVSQIDAESLTRVYAEQVGDTRRS